jgi:hypothetical protein
MEQYLLQYDTSGTQPSLIRTADFRHSHFITSDTLLLFSNELAPSDFRLFHILMERRKG